MTSGALVDRVYIFIKIHSSFLAGYYIKTRMPPSLIRFSGLQDVKDSQVPGTTSMNLGHLATRQNQPGSETKKPADDTSFCPSETHFQHCYVALVPACVRERGTWTFSLSTASSLLKDRKKNFKKRETESLKVNMDHPKQFKSQGRKQMKKGQRNNLAVFRWSRHCCYCWLH